MATARRIREYPQDRPDEAVLAVARALAIRYAREDHAAEQARLERRPPPDLDR